MFLIFQNNISDYVMDPLVSLPAETRKSVVEADEEILAVLEEVVMYTFQQTVYYLTKVNILLIIILYRIHERFYTCNNTYRLVLVKS